MKENLSRREFIQIARLLTSGAALTACIPRQKESLPPTSTPETLLTPTIHATETPETIFVPATLVEGNPKIFENEGRVLSVVGVDLGQGKRIDFAKVQIEGTQTPGEFWTEGFKELLSLWIPPEWGDKLLINPTEKEGYRFEVGKDAMWASFGFTRFELKDGTAVNVELKVEKGVANVDFVSLTPLGEYHWKDVLSTQIYFRPGGKLTVAGFDGSKYPNDEWKPFVDTTLTSRVRNGDKIQLQLIPKDIGTLLFILDEKGKELGKVDFGQDMFPSKNVGLYIGGSPESVFNLDHVEIAPRTYRIIRSMLAVWVGKSLVVTKASETPEGAWYSQQATESNGQLKIKSDSPEVEVLSPKGEIKYPVSETPVVSSVRKKDFDKALVYGRLTVEKIYPFERLSEGYLAELFPTSEVFMSERGDVVVINKGSKVKLAGQEVQTKYGNFCLLISQSYYQKSFEKYFKKSTPYSGYPNLTTLYPKDELVRIYLTLVGLQQRETSLGNHLSTYTPRKKNFTFVRGGLGEAVLFSEMLPKGLYDAERSYYESGGALSPIMKASGTSFVQTMAGTALEPRFSPPNISEYFTDELGGRLVLDIMQKMIRSMLYHSLNIDTVLFHNKYRGVQEIFLKSPFSPLFSHPEIEKSIEAYPATLKFGIEEIAEVNFEKFK